MFQMLTKANQAVSRVALCAAALAFLLAPVASAQPLVDKVPGDVILYVGWTGSQHMPPAYQESHLKAVLEMSGFEKLIDETIPALVEKFGGREKELAQVTGLLNALGKPMWKHPTALFIQDVQINQDGPPMPKLGLLCQAGADAAKMKQAVDDLLKEAPEEAQQMVKTHVAGDLFAVTVGYPALPEGGLAADATFKATLEHVSKQPVFAIYANVEKALKIANQAIAQAAPERDAAMWTKVRDSIGLAGIKQVMLTSGFDGKDWIDQAFIAAPEPRTGVLKLMDAGPVSNDALKLIPHDATMLGAGKADLAKIFATIREIIVGVEPRAAEEINKGIAEANKALGLDIEKDVLGALGDEWAYYVDPTVGGRSPLGFVAINRCRDAKKAEASLLKMQQFITDMAAKEIREKDIKLQFYKTEVDGTTIHYLGTPLLTPSWAIKDGNLYFALFPQVVAGAAAHVSGGGKSILENDYFQKMRDRLGAPNASLIEYVDLPRTAPDGYAMWTAISRLTGFSDLVGVQSPAMLLPPLYKLMPHLSPAADTAWTDKAGWHFKMISPFPGSMLLSTDPIMVALMQAPMMVGLAMPQMGRARGQAQDIQSMNNLRQIGLAAIIYANEHKGKLPPDLAELAKAADVTPEVFQHPTRNRPVPRFENPDAMAVWIRDNSDYVYVGGGKKASDPNATETIIAHERFGLSPGGVACVFLDGHVERLSWEDAQRRLGGGGAVPPPPDGVGPVPPRPGINPQPLPPIEPPRQIEPQPAPPRPLPPPPG